MKKTNSFIYLFGMAYIILAFVRLNPNSFINGKFMLYIGGSACILLVTDFLDLLINKQSSWMKLLVLFRYMLYSLAVFIVIVLPMINIKIPVKLVNTLSDVFTLAGFGLAIILMGLKQKKIEKMLHIENEQQKEEK